MADEPKRDAESADGPASTDSTEPAEAIVTGATTAAPPADDPPSDLFAATGSARDDDDDEFAGADLPDSGKFKLMLKMAVEAPPPPPKTDLLLGVQKKLRERSEGKFYADGWSTREENPRFTYLITAIVMLALVLLAYFSLVPGDVGKLP
jgi:hypothetical protein